MGQSGVACVMGRLLMRVGWVQDHPADAAQEMPPLKVWVTDDQSEIVAFPGNY